MEDAKLWPPTSDPRFLDYLCVREFSPKCRGQSPGCTPADETATVFPTKLSTTCLRASVHTSVSPGKTATTKPSGDVPANLSTAQVDMSGSEGKDLALARGSLTSNPGGLVHINAKGVSSNLINQTLEVSRSTT